MLKCVFLPTTVANERNRARKKDVRDRHTSLLFHRPPEADDFIFPRFLIAPTHVIRSCVTWFPLINTPKLYSGAREKKWCFLVRDDDQLTHRHILINRTELVGWCYFGPHRFRLVCRLWFLLNSDNVASLHSSLSPRSRLATKLSRDRGRWRRESECYYVDCGSSLGSWMGNNHWEETTIKIGWKKKNGRMKETFTPNREYIRKSNDTESSFYGELFLFHPRKMSTCR